jgi:signal transduction histidine kinase
MTRDGTPLGEDTQALLVERLRAGFWLILIGIVAFAVVDPIAHPAQLWPLIAVQAVEIVAALAAFAALRTQRGREHAILVALAFVCLLSITTATSGYLMNDAVTTPLLLSLMSMGTATLLPWGVRPQLVTQTVAALCALWNVASVGGPESVTFVPVAILMGSLASIYAAYTLERYRRARRRAERELLSAQAEQRHADVAHAARLNTLGGMAAGLAHELNQPLAAIVAYARGCSRRIESGDASLESLLPAVNEIATQALRAGEILRRIRDFVRHGEQRREPVDVNELVREAARLADLEARQLGVTVRLELAPGIPTVEADPIQVEQVVLNLVRNGFEAMRETEGDRLLSIRTAHEQGGVEVAVQDTGNGVPAGIVDRLFDPFFTTKRDGLGLGLSISRSLIEANGGRLWAAPNGTGGATFRFALPARGARHAA